MGFGLGLPQGIGLAVKLEGFGAVDRHAVARLVAVSQLEHGLHVARGSLFLQFVHLLRTRHQGGRKHHQ